MLATLAIGFADAGAATKRKTTPSKSAENPRYAAIVVNAGSGEVLMARYADSIRHPASLTKMMTLYMVFDAIERGTLSLSDRVTISKHAASQSPSKLGLAVGSRIRVEDAIKALVTKSANDIAVALSEKLSGSEKKFATRMTRKAHELGMSRTTFRNASGLPDPQQVTTARDMAKLAMALLRDYPHRYHYFGIRNFEYNGASHHNHNRLLGEYRGLDGIKTGYINASGFNLVASAKQNGRRLIGVVFGGQSWRSRNDHMVKLLDEGFAELSVRGDRIQEASLSGSARAPVPLPPPMPEDIRTPGSHSYGSDDDAEDEGAYSAGASKKLTSMIDRVQSETYTSSGASSGSTPPVPSYRPQYNDAGAAATATAVPRSFDENATSPAGAARTVMQLRIPRDKLPSGVPSSQIVSSGGGHDWSVQIGAFQSRAMTDQALRTAQSRLPAHLQHATPIIVPQNTGQGLIFRARLQGYDELQANSACAHLGSCLVVSPGS